jgi:hypothetical protein
MRLPSWPVDIDAWSLAAGLADKGFCLRRYYDTRRRERRKGLAGYTDPHLPCATPSIRTLQEVFPALVYAKLLSLKIHLFRTVSGFTDVTINVDALVLDAVMASLLIHLEEISGALTKERASSGYTSHYRCRFHVALDTNNTALGAGLTLATCMGGNISFEPRGERKTFSNSVGAVGATRLSWCQL